MNNTHWNKSIKKKGTPVQNEENSFMDTHFNVLVLQ